MKTRKSSESIIPKLLKSRGFIEVRTPFYIGAFAKDSPAKKAGLKKGDKLVGVNTSVVEYSDEFKDTLSHYINENVIITALRAY